MISPKRGILEKTKEGCELIKGINRRVVVVKAPDRRFFEEAIFILREDILNKNGVTADDIVAEARRVAEEYGKRHAPKQREWTKRLGCVLLGVCIALLFRNAVGLL